MREAMSEIPDDVMKVAESIVAGMPQRMRSAHRPFTADVIARAILAERERCAGIAHEWDRDIASAIRGTS